MQLLAGRYGPYVTDGVTNASLPRGTAPEEVTLEYALNLLKARAEQGPSTRPARRTAKKAAGPEESGGAEGEESGEKGRQEGGEEIGVATRGAAESVPVVLQG